MWITYNIHVITINFHTILSTMPVWTLRVGDGKFVLSWNILHKMLHNISGKYEEIGKRTIYIDRRALWIGTIIDHFRGYTIDIPYLIETSDTVSRQMLIDDLQFFGITQDAPDAQDDRYTSITNIDELKTILSEFANNYYLRLGDEKLYHEICNEKTICDAKTLRHQARMAEKAIAFAEYNEYITSWTMKIVGSGLKLWQSKTGVDTSSLHESIETRLSEDDVLLQRVHEFSDTIKEYSFLSWVVDNARMFIVNYFAKTQTC